MSGSTENAVECPICGEGFDPSAAGGWCTNPKCGEWRIAESDVPRDEAPLPEEPVDESEPDDSGPEDAGQTDAESDGAQPDDSRPNYGEADDAEADDAEADDAKPDDPEAEGAEATDSHPEVDTESGDAEQGVDGVVEGGDGDGDQNSEREPAPETDAASETGEQPPAQAVESESNESDDSGHSAAAGTAAADATTCPSCGGDVTPTDNFCAACGEELASSGVTTLGECPECGDDVDPSDSFCATCGEDLDEHRAGGTAETETSAGDTDEPETTNGEATESQSDAEGAGNDSPESLILKARGGEITVSDGDAVGRDVRSLITDTGGDEDEAVRVHREHVKFVREGGQFYVVDLGENPTRLNGRALRKGDREPVRAGNELELSGVVTLTIARP